MSRYLQLKLGLSFIGLVLLVWGIRTDDTGLRWIAIGFLAASVLMRLLPKRFRGGDDKRPRPPTSPGTPAS